MLRRDPEADRVLARYAAEIGQSIELNGRFAGTWHIWFAAEDDTVRWFAMPLAAGGRRVHARTAGELAGRIETATRRARGR